MNLRWTLPIVAFVLGLTACTPQQALLMSVLPDGMAAALLGNLEKVEEKNRIRIVELEAKKDWEGLAKFAEENIAKDPRSPEWWMVKGYAYGEMKRHDREIAAYQESVRLAPDDVSGWNLLAQAYRSNNQPDRAIRTLDNALMVTRQNPATFTLLGELYAETGRDSSAINAYQAAVKLDPKQAEGWFGLGRSYVRTGRTKEAREALIALKPLSVERAVALEALLLKR
jgi:cytochrome c-type biogenesis protein CcmH/NrfG